jgi:hypothetical protein
MDRDSLALIKTLQLNSKNFNEQKVKLLRESIEKSEKTL